MASSITDNLGRTISAGIDQSELMKQLADSMRQGVGEPTKWKGGREKGETDKIADLVKNLPEKLYDKFSDDIAEVTDYIKIITDHYKSRKEKKTDARQGRQDVADAIVKLGQSLTKGLSAASHTHLSGIAAGVSALVAAVGTLNTHAGVIATGITSLEKHATKKGSLYVHDIHVQALLSDIQKENRVLLGEIAGVLLEAGGKNRDAIDKVQAAPQVVGPDFVEAVSKMGPVKVPAEFDGSPSSTTTTKAADGLPDQMGEGVKKRFDGTQNTNEVLENLVKLLRKETGYHAVNEHLLESSAATIRRTLKDLRTTGQLNDKMLAQTANLLNDREELSKEANKEIDLLLKQLAIGNKVGDSLVELSQLAEKYKDQLHRIRNVWDDIRADAINHSRHLTHITVAGLHAGYELSSVTKGIWGEQVKHNTALRAGLFETMNMTAEADHLREAYMKAGREASAVAESGQDMMTFQATYRKNLRAGVKDLNTLNRLTRTGLNLGTMIGANAEATADTFRQWHQTTGMTTNQMAQLNRSIQHAGVATGVVGDELLQAVHAAKELADNMRDAGTLTAEAAGRFIQMSAAAKKMGSEKSVLPILKALSGTDELYNHTDPAQQALLFRSAARTGQLEQLREGTVTNDPAAMKKLVGGMKDEFNSYLKQFGVTVDTMHKLTEAQKAQINLQKPFGLKAGEIKRFFDTVEEGTLTFEDRLKSINKQLEGNLTQQERATLLDQQRSLTLQKSLSDLTKFDEASKGTSSMDEALKKAGMTPTTLAANLSDAVKSVNADLVKQGLGKDQIDVNRLSGAMNDPARVSKLIEDIGTAQQKAAVQKKASSDPVSEAILQTEKWNATIASKTGAMASYLLALVGSNGVVAASVASMALNSSAGQNLLTQGLAKGFDFIKDKAMKRAAAVSAVGDAAKAAAPAANTLGLPVKQMSDAVPSKGLVKDVLAKMPIPGAAAGAAGTAGKAAVTAGEAVPAATSALGSLTSSGGIFSKLLGFLGKILSVGKFVVRFLGPIGAAIGIVMTVIEVLGMLGVNLSDITGIFTDFSGTLKSIGKFILNLRVLIFNKIMELGKWVVEGLKYVFLDLPSIIFDWVIDGLKGLAANEWIGPFFEPFVELFTTIKGIVVDALSPLQEVYDAFKDVFSVLDSGSAEMSIFSQVMDFLKQTIRNNAAVLGWLIRTGLEPMVQMFKVVGQVVKWSLESWVKPLKALAKWIGGIVKFWKGVLTLDFKKMGEGISDIFSGFLGFLWESIMRVPKMLWKAFTGVFVDFPVWLFKQIKSGLNGLKDWLISLLPRPLRPSNPNEPEKKRGWKDAAVGVAIGAVPLGGMVYNYGMGMLSDGADLIRQTGPRIIHEGEMVVPAKVAEEWRAAAMTDQSFTLDKVFNPVRQMGALPKFLSSFLPESFFGSVVPASQRAANSAQGMLGGMAVNADPVASATTPQPVPMGMETAETQIEQRLASAAAPPAVNAANRVLTEIERNTRDTADGVRTMNTTMRQVLAVLSGGGSGGTGGDGDTSTREMPGSTPIWPRLMTNYNGGARKRFLQVGL